MSEALREKARAWLLDNGCGGDYFEMKADSLAALLAAERADAVNDHCREHLDNAVRMAELVDALATLVAWVDRVPGHRHAQEVAEARALLARARQGEER